MTDREIIKEFCANVSGLYKLDTENGQVLANMLSNAVETNSGLIVYTKGSWRESMLAQLGYKTDKVLKKILKELSEKKIVIKVDSYSYLLSPDIFGKQVWANLENYSITINVDKHGKHYINIHRTQIDGVCCEE